MASAANEHQEWINNPQSGYGGMDNYVANQQARYGEAVANNDMELVGKLQADASRVGYLLQQPNQGYNQNPELANMGQYLQGASDNYLKQQQAALESNLNAQISELQAAYQDAVAQGKLSVRDAEAQFDEQLKQIQQQAYQDAERTSLYGQQMGIQNSQQMMGLMQGDMARKNALVNESATERDRRINDIKDRMDAIRSQKDISIARAQADYRTGMLGAEGEAQRMYSEGMFGLMQDEYSAQRDQRYARENMYLQDELTRGQMGVQHGYNMEINEQNLKNNMQLATHESMLMIERMNIQQGFDLQKMSQALSNDIAKMAYSFGKESILQDKAFQRELDMLEKKYELNVRQSEDEYRRQLQRELRGVTPGTKEYEIITANNERDLKNKLAELHAGTVYEAVTSKIVNEYPGENIGKPPTDYTKDPSVAIDGVSVPVYSSPFGSLKNWLSRYDKKQTEYEKQLEAQRRYQDMIGAAGAYFPFNY